MEEKAYTAEQLIMIGERIKEAFYCEFDELIPSIMEAKIDEIINEILVQ